MPPNLVGAPRPVILADLNLSVVTPMFGGGVEPGVNEVDNLIRPSAIRGHLRFWWRACNAARFSSLAELHEEERAIWGSAAKKNDPTTGPAAIGVRVTILRRGSEFAHQDGPPFVMFPFVENNDSGRSGIRFRLRLTIAPRAGEWVEWPDVQRCKDAAEQALWAWITFGGVGSRTRRGCGTLHCTGNGDETPADALGEHRLDTGLFQPSGDVLTWLEQGIAKHAKGGLPSCISLAPSLTGCRIAVGPTADRLIPAWNAAVEPLRAFLQGEGIGRNRRHPNSNRPGQSYWPEVGAARAIIPGVPARIDDYSDGHTKLATADATGKQFPRTDLGLPKQIKLASENDAPIATVERDQPGFTRMASPIVLKALPLLDGGAVPIALLLVAPHVWDPGTPGLKLKGPGVPRQHLDPLPLNDLDPNNRPSWPRTFPRNVLDSGVKSARDAFMNFVASRNGWVDWP